LEFNVPFAALIWLYQRREEEEETTGQKYNGLPYSIWATIITDIYLNQLIQFIRITRQIFTTLLQNHTVRRVAGQRRDRSVYDFKAQLQGTGSRSECLYEELRM